MNTQTNDKCRLCMDPLDVTDKQLMPCKCGYEICLYCCHQTMGMDQDQKDESGGRCPGCRSVYDKDRILEIRNRNQILKELCADKENYQKERTKSQKQTSAKGQLGLSEAKDPNNVRVIQRKLVYIVGMPNEFASEKLLRQENFLGQYGMIENIIINNIGANQQIPDSGRVYVTFAREEEAVRCIQAVNGYILDGRPLKATFGVTRYCNIWLSNRVCYKANCSYVHYKPSAEDICTKDDDSVVCARLQHLMGMDAKGPQHRSGSTLPPPGDSSSRTSTCSGISKDRKGNICILKIGFPTPQRERKVAEVFKDNAKDKKEYHDPPEEGLPQPAPQQNVEEEDNTLKKFYQIAISSLEDRISSIDKKVAEVIRDVDTSPANAKKKARKLGRGLKFLESVKAKMSYMEDAETAEELMGMTVALEEQGGAMVAADQHHQALEEQGGAMVAADQHHQGACSEPITEELVGLDIASGCLDETGAALPDMEACAKTHGAKPEPKDN